MSDLCNGLLWTYSGIEHPKEIGINTRIVVYSQVGKDVVAVLDGQRIEQPLDRRHVLDAAEWVMDSRRIEKTPRQRFRATQSGNHCVSWRKATDIPRLFPLKYQTTPQAQYRQRDAGQLALRMKAKELGQRRTNTAHSISGTDSLANMEYVRAYLLSCNLQKGIKK